jgi:magnesium chelatase family protein
VEVSAVPWKELSDDRAGEPSASIRARVNLARARQRERFGEHGPAFNAAMRSRDVKRHCHPSAEALGLLEKAIDRRGLGAGTCVIPEGRARTIADLEVARDGTAHVAEAIQYRSLDRAAI